MYKAFHEVGATGVTIEITKEGTVTYTAGGKKTTFDINRCDPLIYRYKGGEETVIITETDLTSWMSETSPGSAIEPRVWMVICEGERRLEVNNNLAETRRHYSYSMENDKINTLASDADALDHVLATEKKEAVRRSIRHLQPQQRELIYDIYYRGMSMAEVAQRDGVHRSSVT